MEEIQRKSGIDFIGDLPWGAHFCQFYQTKEDLTNITIPYFKAGLENNEYCLWVIAYPIDKEETKEVLRKDIPGFDMYLENGQIEIISYTDWYEKEGLFNSDRILNGLVKKLNQAMESGYEGLRLAGNNSWLEKEDWSNIIDYEQKLDAVINNYHMIALCTYSLDMRDVTEAINVVANHQFTLIKKEGKWERIENSGQKNINERKKAEKMLRQSERYFGMGSKCDIPSPARDMQNLEFAKIIDTQAIQSLMNDFNKLVHIPMGLTDLKGNVLVSAGWQDICTKFHRIHPEACKHCIESDIELSKGVAPGEFKLYKCKNNMWDVVTPIMLDGHHVGNILSGQFFFDNEPLDYELFRSQARKYGFNEKEYMSALEKTPRLSREAVDTIMVFFMTFANMISQLSYSNIRLAQSLAERDILVDALREREKCELARLDELEAVMDAVPVAVFITRDPKALLITGNRLSYEWVQLPVGTNCSKSAPAGERPEMFKLFKDGVEIPPENMPSQMAAAGMEVNDYELDIVSDNGKIRHVLGNARPLRDEQCNPRGSISAFIDITERKKAEEVLKKEHDDLEKLVEERTKQLENAYSLLKESEQGLAEAQKMAHIGNWEWDIATDKAYWSEEMYRIFKRNPQETAPSYDEYLNYVHPDDRDYFDNAAKRAIDGKPYSIDHRIVLANGEVRTVHIQSQVFFDEKNIPVRIKGIVQDITERKKAEKALFNLELTRKRKFIIALRITSRLSLLYLIFRLRISTTGNVLKTQIFSMLSGKARAE